jgi:hypothetical protein
MSPAAVFTRTVYYSVRLAVSLRLTCFYGTNATLQIAYGTSSNICTALPFRGRPDRARLLAALTGSDVLYGVQAMVDPAEDLTGLLQVWGIGLDDPDKSLKFDNTANDLAGDQIGVGIIDLVEGVGLGH